VEAPVCRLCGARHWGGDHVWPRGMKVAARQSIKPAKVELSVPVPDDPSLAPRELGFQEAETDLPGISVPTTPPREMPEMTSPVDRKAYQREYMKLRRHREREAKRRGAEDER
jgi:hypothetical protein